MGLDPSAQAGRLFACLSMTLLPLVLPLQGRSDLENERQSGALQYKQYSLTQKKEPFPRHTFDLLVCAADDPPEDFYDFTAADYAALQSSKKEGTLVGEGAFSALLN